MEEAISSNTECTLDGSADGARAGRFWLGGWIAALALRALWLSLVLEPSRAVFSDMEAYFARSKEMFESAHWSPYAFFQGAGYPLVLGSLRALWADDALWRPFRRREPGAEFGDLWLALVCPVLALFATVWLFKSEIRYRMPFDIFLIPLALWGLKESGALIRARMGWRWGAQARAAPCSVRPDLPESEATRLFRESGRRSSFLQVQMPGI